MADSTAIAVADVEGPGEDSPGPRRGVSLSGGTLFKYLLLILFDGLALWGIIKMIELSSWLPLAITVVATVAVNVVYWARGRIPGKYLLPMAIILTLFAVIPVVYNVYISFTNSGTGNLITKEQAIDRLNQVTPEDISVDHRSAGFGSMVMGREGGGMKEGRTRQTGGRVKVERRKKRNGRPPPPPPAAAHSSP